MPADGQAEGGTERSARWAATRGWCVVRGETSHTERGREECRGGARVGLEAGLPVVYGVVTADNTEQAGSGSQQAGDRGRDAALVAVEMATFLRALHPEIA
jgi:6,7-dimethyl-8-ribityllumazine synthase